MPDTYDHITLMCRLKAAQRRNKELESGERYIQLEELHQKEYNVYEHKIEKLKKELADAHKETIRALNAEKQRDNALDKAAVFRHQFYEAASRLEEEQAENQAGSPVTKGTAGKGRSLHSQLFSFLHLKKCSKTVLLKRLPGPS
nr:hypothetical protein [uncultured Blautia sp.]